MDYTVLIRSKCMSDNLVVNYLDTGIQQAMCIQASKQARNLRP